MNYIEIDIEFDPTMGHDEKAVHLLRLVLRNQLIIQKEIRDKMSDIQTAVQGVKDAVTNELATLSETLGAKADALAQRVIDSINTGDTSGAIAQLQTLASDVKSEGDAVAATLGAKLDAIDPTQPATPPTVPIPGQSPAPTGPASTDSVPPPAGSNEVAPPSGEPVGGDQI